MNQKPSRVQSRQNQNLSTRERERERERERVSVYVCETKIHTSEGKCVMYSSGLFSYQGPTGVL